MERGTNEHTPASTSCSGGSPQAEGVYASRVSDDPFPGELFGDEHVRAYRETGGERGYDWKRGTTILLLTTTGRKSAEPRTTPLIFRPDGERWVVVASKGGWPENPSWYENLQASPEATIQVRSEEIPV